MKSPPITDINEETGSGIKGSHLPEARPRSLALGANVRQGFVSYRVWAPKFENLIIEIKAADGGERLIRTVRDELGHHEAKDAEGRAGDRYRLKLPNGEVWADPVSRAQESEVRGWSLVVDPSQYVWQDQDWRRPDFRDLVIYELHVGTFTHEGTFRAAIDKLPTVKELGINAIEIMPIADFPGSRNWGYDGVLLYAPARAYGSPDDLRALVDAAHREGIAVILDVVYNHVGPEGSGLAALSPAYFNQARHTPWGAAFNFDGPDSAPVREFFASNPVYWMEEFHIDGVRLDATHAMVDESPYHILAEIADRVHALGGYVIAEDERNEVRLVESKSEGGYDLNAVWADDFHHTIRVGQTRETHAYLQNFNGALEETLDTLRCGWRFRGQLTTVEGTRRGSDCSHVPPERMIHCISNHDQVGNQAFGTRLSSHTSPAAYRASSMLLCLTPYTPMIFMGQEWAASSPFLYFTDHPPGLGKLVTEGRRREFSDFPGFKDGGGVEDIPDPQARETFVQSKLKWDEMVHAPHAGIHALYKACLNLRKSEPAFRPRSREGWTVEMLEPGLGCVRYWTGDGRCYLLVMHLWPNKGLISVDLRALPWPEPGMEAEVVMSSEAPAFGGRKAPPDVAATAYVFDEVETLLLRGYLPEPAGS
jgi:maltooligosyltrehalose trehalohydrolase